MSEPYQNMTEEERSNCHASADTAHPHIDREVLAGLKKLEEIDRGNREAFGAEIDRDALKCSAKPMPDGVYLADRGRLDRVVPGAADRAPDAALTLNDLAMMHLDDALEAQRRWYDGELSRERLNATKWKRRHGSACEFGTAAVAVIIVLLVPHVWRLAAWAWRLI